MYGQEAVSQPQTAEWYLQKSKNQKTTAWVLLISGTAMAIGGAIAFDKSWEESSNSATDIAGIVMLAGVGADLASIHFFVKAGQNKRKAASLAFNMQNYLPYHENSVTLNPVPSMSLRIKF
jgi:hypothetical protein